MSGEAESIIVKFCYLGVLWSLVGECWWSGAESLIHIFIPRVTQGNEDVGSVEDFILSFLCESRELGGRQGESNIPLCNPSGGKILLRAPTSYNKVLDRVAFRILSNIHDGAPMRKQPTALRHWQFPQKIPKLDVWGVGGLQVHGICRLLHRKVFEARSNYKRSYLWWFRNTACGNSTGRNGTEKYRVRLPPRLSWGNKGESGGLI